MPRFIVLNNLEVPLVLKQKNHEKQKILLPNEKEIYNFENKEKFPYMQVRQQFKKEITEQKLSIAQGMTDNMWSSAFSIEDLEDF